MEFLTSQATNNEAFEKLDGDEGSQSVGGFHFLHWSGRHFKEMINHSVPPENLECIK